MRLPVSDDERARRAVDRIDLLQNLIQVDNIAVGSELRDLTRSQWVRVAALSAAIARDARILGGLPRGG